MGNVVYILDAYNPYHNNADVRYVFRYHGLQWCVRQVQLEWGAPIFTEKDVEDDFTNFHIYETLDEALQFVRELKKGERPDVPQEVSSIRN